MLFRAVGMIQAVCRREQEGRCARQESRRTVEQSSLFSAPRPPALRCATSGPYRENLVRLIPASRPENRLPPYVSDVFLRFWTLQSMLTAPTATLPHDQWPTFDSKQASRRDLIVRAVPCLGIFWAIHYPLSTIPCVRSPLSFQNLTYPGGVALTRERRG
jgi:hypothetical protein